MKNQLSGLRFWLWENRLCLAVLGLSYAVIFGAAFAMLSEYGYDIQANPDIDTYLKLAGFDFDQSPVRRYRVIVPFLAAGLDFIFGPVFSMVEPYNFPGPDFSLCMSFFMVNSFLMALFGLVIFLLCKACGCSNIGSLIGLLSVLTCRWTAYFAGLPLVDSLYVLIIAVALLGLKTGNSKLLILSIFIGPWAKESFVFIAPLIFLYAPMNRWKQAGWFALSGILVFAFRYYFDVLNHIDAAESLQKDVAHFHQILPSLKRLFSFHGLYELFSIFGPWGALFLLLLKKEVRTALKLQNPVYTIVYLAIVLLHALLSTELARMFYLLAPILAICFAVIVDVLLKLNQRVIDI